MSARVTTAPRCARYTRRESPFTRSWCRVSVSLPGVLLVLIVCTPGRTATAKSVDEMFADALRAYDVGEYDRAIHSFGRLWADYHVRSPALLVDIGAAYFNAGKPGAALYSFLLTQRLWPGSKEALTARQNAVRVRRFLTKRHKQSLSGSGFVFTSYADVWATVFSGRREGLATTVFIALWTLAFLWGALVVTWRSGRSPMLSWWISAFLVVCTMAAGIWSYGEHKVNGRITGVILRPETPLFPSVSSLEASLHLPEGAEVRVVETRGSFVEVELPSGKRGVIPENSIAIVRPDRPELPKNIQGKESMGARTGTWSTARPPRVPHQTAG